MVRKIKKRIELKQHHSQGKIICELDGCNTYEKRALIKAIQVLKNARSYRCLKKKRVEELFHLTENGKLPHLIFCDGETIPNLAV